MCDRIHRLKFKEGIKKGIPFFDDFFESSVKHASSPPIATTKIQSLLELSPSLRTPLPLMGEREAAVSVQERRHF